MIIREDVPLRDHTTFHMGGPVARFVIAETAEEVPEAYAYAKAQSLAPYPLGQGSNVLAGDGALTRAVIQLAAHDITFEPGEEGIVFVHADAGVAWDDLVSRTVDEGLWGLENLAGIPGTVGAAPVQNIGAYGAEVKDTLVSLTGYDSLEQGMKTYRVDECGFGYRTSRFKRAPGFFITHCTFALSRTSTPRLQYPDIQARIASGAVLDTSAEIAKVIRDIRAQKFPDLTLFGTAGSFFKNPVITKDEYDQLHEQYPALPGYETAEGIKIPLAWILDHALSLRGYTLGTVALFERQPLVLVAEKGATSADVDALAETVTKKVFEATHIRIEREVQTVK